MVKAFSYLQESGKGQVSCDGFPRQLANIEIVIAEWLEAARELGRPITEPKGRLLFA